MVNKKNLQDNTKILEALERKATGYDYEEKEIIADKNGIASKVKIIKKHMPPDLNAIKYIMSNEEGDKKCEKWTQLEM